MFPFKVQSKSHQLIRTSSGRFVLRPLFQRSCGPLPRFMKRSSFLRLRRQRVSLSYWPTTRQENIHTVLAKTVCLRPMQAVHSFIRENFAQPAGDLHRPRILSGILKSVAVALGVTVIPPWMSYINVLSKTRFRLKFIRIVRKQPRIRKILSVVRRRHQDLRLTFNSLTFATFSVFIVWDIRHLSHEEPVDGEIQKTVREDPAAALSNARKELARMMNEKKPRC